MIAYNKLSDKQLATLDKIRSRYLHGDLQNKKILAIKEARSIINWGLKDSKELVETWLDGNTVPVSKQDDIINLFNEKEFALYLSAGMRTVIERQAAEIKLLRANEHALQISLEQALTKIEELKCSNIPF
tara:strand:+ start:323 stop:712 length:390 start_codon:yes stop_codon:yes gene_type:complete